MAFSDPRAKARAVSAVAALLAAATFTVLAQSQPQPPSGRGAARPAPSAQRTTPRESEVRPLRVLFLGRDQAPHSSPALFPPLTAALARRGIQLTHVLTPADAFAAGKLSHYDALIIYGDQSLTPEQHEAMDAFLDSGKGVLAIHTNTLTAKAGAAGSAATLAAPVTAEIIQPDNPIVKSVQPFATSDEAPPAPPAGSTVLMERAGVAGKEPFTWLTPSRKGRLYYTGYGHDAATWSNPNFQKLIEQALVWSVAEPARRAYLEMKMPEVTYVDTFVVPNYENRDPAPKYQLPFTADDSMKFIQVPAEFRLELFAKEPDIIEPIAFNFDERGRLWIIEAIDYPNVVLNGQPGDDRIKIVE